MEPSTRGRGHDPRSTARTLLRQPLARIPLDRARRSHPRDPEKLRLLPLPQILSEQPHQSPPVHGFRQKRVTASSQALLLVPPLMARRLGSEEVLERLSELFLERGAPAQSLRVRSST